MPEYTINGIPVMFPFEPYHVQRAYMEKVISCLEDSTNGVLESPTGTGKTLSLLCSALAWTQRKKRQVQDTIQEQLGNMEKFNDEHGIDASKLPGRRQLVENLVQSLNGPNANQKNMLGVPRIIYSSRTHSQISQGNLLEFCYFFRIYRNASWFFYYSLFCPSPAAFVELTTKNGH